MSQKLLEPFRKLPQQFHNLNLIQKLHDLTIGRTNEQFGSSLACAYGGLESPSALSFDVALGLLAVGTTKGVIKIYGSPGIVLPVQLDGSPVIQLCFLPQEGRLLSASTDGRLSLHELDRQSGRWTNVSSVRAVTDQETITALALGHGIVYVGSSRGSVYQVAVQNGRLCIGDPSLTSCTSAMVIESVPIEKRQDLGVDSAVVTLESQPGGNGLLIAYSGGCVVVAVPQSVPKVTSGETATTDTQSTSNAEQEAVMPPTDVPVNGDGHVHIDGSSETTKTPFGSKGDVDSLKTGNTDTVEKPTVDSPIKEHTEKRATLKLKEFTRSLRRFEITKQEQVEVDPPLPVPPAPRISHILLRDQPVEWATWRIANTDAQASEVTVAYGDGAFQIWPITAVADQESFEPVIVTKRDPPSTPYGPLPCGAIKKIIQSPCTNGGGILTAFCGGLPRAEFHDRHAVSVLQDQEHHVCFQCGSPVIDFILIPRKWSPPEESTIESHITTPVAPRDAAALLILTERELIAVDLQQTNWPTFSSPYLVCLDVSPVTAISHVTKISDGLFSRLRGTLESELGETTSSSWPVWGGQGADDCVDFSRNDSNDLVILGHANGWVTLLNIGLGDSVHRLGTFYADSLFNLADSPNGMNCCSTIEIETWPPFRRVGDCALAHPVCIDHPDPRLAVSQLDAFISEDSFTIAVGGAAGQVSLWTVSSKISGKSAFEPDVGRICCNLIEADHTNAKYIWKGLPALRPLEGFVQTCSSDDRIFTPCGLVQLDPPAPVTALALESSWNLLAVGSPHGFALIDLLSKNPIHMSFLYTKITNVGASKSSRSVNVSSVQTAIVNRGKQITSQMRQSFRRLKQFRTSTTTSTPTKPNDEPEAPQDTQSSEPPAESAIASEGVVGNECQPSQEIAAPVASPLPETTPACEPAISTASDGHEPVAQNVDTASTEPNLETQPESIALNPDEFGPSTVRSITFVDTFVTSPIPATNQHPAVPSLRMPSLWIGTAHGRVTVHSLSWEGVSGPVLVQLHKELQLQHRASVIGLRVIDVSTRGPVLNNLRIRTGCETKQDVGVTAATADDASNDEELKNQPVNGTTTTNHESHQLLVCSEEQVKIFQLPSLRALHKHKFVDRLRLPGHSVNSPPVNSNSGASEATAPPPTESEAAEKNIAEPITVEVAVESEHRSAVTVPQPHCKTLTSFGLQSFCRGTSEQPKTEWDVVVSRFDGQVVILSLPNLRKLFKVPPMVDTSIPCLPYVTSVDSNLVFWQSGRQLLVTELSPISRLSSPAVLLSGAHNRSQFVSIRLPDWARSSQQAAAETNETSGVDRVVASDTTEQSPATVACTSTTPTDTVVNGAAVEYMTELVESAPPLAEKYPTAALHAGDVTLDSIKEYLNGDGTVTIKTIETSSEKRTLVEGGHVVTTVRETERVDGQLTKDDVLKFSTENQPATHVITEVA